MREGSKGVEPIIPAKEWLNRFDPFPTIVILPLANHDNNQHAENESPAKEPVGCDARLWRGAGGVP